MTRALLLRIAAALALITCLGHTVGTFMKVPAEQVAMHETIAIMKKTMVPMPVGAARSYMQILDGNNLCTSLLLLVFSAVLFSLAKAPRDAVTNQVLMVITLGLFGFALLSGLYFFPVPVVFTSIAGLLCLVARSR